MMETGMKGAGVNKVGHAQLFDITQALKIRVLYQVKYQPRRDADKPVNRVVNDLLFIQCLYYATKVLNSGKYQSFYFS